tara:strand:+ start:42900 stop:43766 length:867 start_codon:yes stop_codon:yes gene_type:complete
MNKVPFFIAEIGINHNGDINICKELIDVAKDAGFDAVKFQKRDIDLVYTKEFLSSPRISPWGNTQRDQKAALEFGISEYETIDSYCKFKSIEWFASAWDVNSQIFLRRFNKKYNKVASPMIRHHKLLDEIASEKKHTFISTGMSELSYIDEAISIFKRHNCPFELMHAVSTYPMNDEDANLKCIETLKNIYKCNVGYSGHEVGIVVSLAAVALGISSLERHITLDRAMYGSDQAASVEPSAIKNLISSAKKITASMGDGVKRVIKDEIPIAKKLRQHLPVSIGDDEYR